VSTIRLSDQERGQIPAAAARLKLPLSSFLRQAALQASAVVERKATAGVPRPVKKEQRLTPTTHSREFQPRELTIIDLERDHHFVDGLCTRCWRDVDERDLPCSRQRKLRA
jgi:hypothetical protein